MNEKQVGQAFKLANECLRAIGKEYTEPVCKAYSGMTCIHPRYLPSCEGCAIMEKRLNKLDKTKAKGEANGKRGEYNVRA